MPQAQQGHTLSREAIYIPEAAPAPLGCYSHAVRAGQFLYVSGQGARDPKTGQEVGVTVDASGQVTAYDIQAQTHQVIRNLRTIVYGAGCRLEDLVDVTVFLADMQDFEAYNQVYAQYFSFENPPARTTIEAKAPGRNFIEIKALALLPGAAREGFA